MPFYTYFENEKEIRDYIAEELLESLYDKLDDMRLDRRSAYPSYTEEDITAMQKRIIDVETYFTEAEHP